MKTDLHKKTGHTGAPRPKLDKKVCGELGKDNINPYCMSPKRRFLTFMYMNIPTAGWIYLTCLAFGKEGNQLQDFTKARLIYKPIFLVAASITLGTLVYIGLDLADKLLAYMEMLQVYLSDKEKIGRLFLDLWIAQRAERAFF